MGWNDYKTERNEAIHLYHLKYPKASLRNIGERFNLSRQRIRSILLVEAIRYPRRQAIREVAQNKRGDRMKLLKREGLNGYVISIIDNDNREIAITEKEWQGLARTMKRFLKMTNTSTLTLA